MEILAIIIASGTIGFSIGWILGHRAARQQHMIYFKSYTNFIVGDVARPRMSRDEFNEWVATKSRTNEYVTIESEE